MPSEGQEVLDYLDVHGHATSGEMSAAIGVLNIGRVLYTLQMHGLICCVNKFANWSELVWERVEGTVM